MPNWSGLILTEKGRQLQAKVQAGTQLALTKFKLGSGVLPAGKQLEALTDLVEPQQNVGIATIEAQDNGTCKVCATISNISLEKGYYVRELGVFATDPDEGEILYLVATDSAPDYLPAEGGATAVSQEFAVYVSASNADNVVAQIDAGALATMGYVERQIQLHNIDSNAHEVAFIKHDTDENAHEAIREKLAALDNLMDNFGVGMIFPYAGKDIPAGFLLCNGAAISRTTYARLFAKIGTLYGTGDGSTTFNLPNLIGRFVEGGDSSTAGSYKAAGLPDIQGAAGGRYGARAGDWGANGAFTVSEWQPIEILGGSDTYQDSMATITFKASLFNSIYGSSSTVQPAAINAQYLIKY